MLQLIIVIAVIGVIVWAITKFAPIPDGFKKLIWVIAIVCVAVYVLAAFGILPAHDIPVPQLNAK